MGATKRKWTSEEDEALEAGIRKHGEGKWKMIHDDPEFRHSFGGRSNKNLRDHYDWYSRRKEIMKKRRKEMGAPRGTWTTEEEEEEALIAGINKHGTGKWIEIQNDPEYSQRLAARSNVDLRNYYCYHLRKKLLFGTSMVEWTSEEEEAFKAGVKKYGAGNWNIILNDPEYRYCLAARSFYDLKEKWRNVVLQDVTAPATPKVPENLKKQRQGLEKKKKWTSEEEEALIAAVNKHGAGKWIDIKNDPEYSHCLAARSNKNLRVKWKRMILTEVPKTPADTGAIKVALNKGAWTDMEDSILSNYIETHGEGGWSTLPTKAGLKKCGDICGMERGDISSGNSWSSMAGRLRLPERTVNEIMSHWNTHLAKKIRDDSCSTSSINSKKKKIMVAGTSGKTQTLSQIVENCEKIRGSTDHCKEMGLESENGFLGCPLGGRNLLQTYEMDCNNGENWCFSEFCQLCSFSGGKRDDFLSPSSEEDSLLFLDETLEDLTGNDVLSDIESLDTVLGSEEDWQNDT